MRAVIAIKSTGGSGASRATRYISERDRDPVREGTSPRPLFSDREDALTYRGADRLLTSNTGTPDKKDLIHIAVSFNKADYERLGPTESERKEQFRELARAAMGETTRDLRAREMRWVAGIHLNTDHPHIHVLIHKEITDLVTGKGRRLGRIPKELLPYSQVRTDGGRHPVEGRIGGHFVEALDRHIERARESSERHIAPEYAPKDKMRIGEWLRDEVKARSTNDSWTERENTTDVLQVRRDRVALGEALEKSLQREYATLDYERALKHGDTFRFPARDASTGNERQISEADVKRRADARGVRAANDQGLRAASERQDIRRQVSEQDVTRHASTIGELHKFRSKLLNRLEKELGKADIERIHAESRAQGIRQRYESSGQKIPTPVIARDKLARLQEQAINHRLTNHVEMLEQLRVALADEHNQPVRDDKEAARLGAQLFTAQTDLHAINDRTSRFDQMYHLQRWEVSGERWSLTDLDREIERQSDQARVIGKYHYHLDPRARNTAAGEVARLTSVRGEVVKRINESRSEFDREVEDSRRLVEVLNHIYEGEVALRSHSGRTMPRPEFTLEELHSIEANADTTRDAALLRQLDEFEKHSAELDSRTSPIKLEERLGRAMAREIVAEVVRRESAERLAHYNERGSTQPLTIEDKTGRISVHRLKETKLNSVIERALRPLIEKSDARDTRRAIEAAAAKTRAHIVTDYEKSRAYLQAAREITDNLRAEARKQGIDSTRLVPDFTPKERINLEIYAERQADPAERAHYISLARGEFVMATPSRETQSGYVTHKAQSSHIQHEHASPFDHHPATTQPHEYDSPTRSTGRAR